MTEVPLAALVASTWLHAGFQLTVSVLVYPALLQGTGEGWAERHATHSRRIAPLVGLVYGSLVVTGVWALAARPGPVVVLALVLVALSASLVAILTTATVAAPAHGRLSAGRDPAIERRLVRSDMVRSAAALVGALASALAVLTT